MKRAFGGVLVDDQERILLCKPRGEFGGYAWTFPKGRPMPGEGPAETALREVREETGYDAVVTGEIPGRYEGTTTVTQFFLMRPIGAPKNFQIETEDVRWVSIGAAEQLIVQSKNLVGKRRDLQLLAAIRLSMVRRRLATIPPLMGEVYQ